MREFIKNKGHIDVMVDVIQIYMLIAKVFHDCTNYEDMYTDAVKMFINAEDAYLKEKCN